MEDNQTTKVCIDDNGNKRHWKCKLLLKKAGKSKVMFVTFIGSYQSKIAKIINSKDVIIGDGMCETIHCAHLWTCWF